MTSGVYPRPSVEERLSRLTREGDVPAFAPELGPCLLWIGGVDKDGYGYIRTNGRQVRAHRAAVEIADGKPIPPHLQVDHLCRVRNCMRRSHLDLVTLVENVKRGFSPSVALGKRTACGKGHDFTPLNTHIALTRTGSTYRICRACAAENARRRAERLRQAEEAKKG